MGRASNIGKGLLVLTAGTIGLVALSPIIKGLKAANGLKFQVGGFKVNNSQPVNLFNVASFLNSIPLRLNAIIKNITQHEYNIEQLFFEIYTLDNRLIASQDMPLSESFVIKKDAITSVPLNFTISTLPAATLASGVSIMKIIDFLQGGKLGKEIRVKGLLRAEGFTIPLDEIIKI